MNILLFLLFSHRGFQRAHAVSAETAFLVVGSLAKRAHISSCPVIFISFYIPPLFSCFNYFYILCARKFVQTSNCSSFCSSSRVYFYFQDFSYFFKYLTFNTFFSIHYNECVCENVTTFTR